jgi:hypothetical protein
MIHSTYGKRSGDKGLQLAFQNTRGRICLPPIRMAYQGGSERTITQDIGGQMFEAVIYDRRDTESKHPGSVVGTFESVEDAWDGIIDHLAKFPDQKQFLVKAEVVKV